MTRELREQNRRSWNAATRAHNSHKADQAAFLRNGGSTLYAEELELLGDVVERRLVHLLCNSGQDSLSLAAMGARVTGVDPLLACSRRPRDGFPCTVPRTLVIG